MTGHLLGSDFGKLVYQDPCSKSFPTLVHLQSQTSQPTIRPNAVSRAAKPTHKEWGISLRLKIFVSVCSEYESNIHGTGGDDGEECPHCMEGSEKKGIRQAGMGYLACEGGGGGILHKGRDGSELFTGRRKQEGILGEDRVTDQSSASTECLWVLSQGPQTGCVSHRWA